MRCVPIVHSIYLMTQVRLCIPNFRLKTLFFFVDSFLSLALFSRCIDSFQLILVCNIYSMILLILVMLSLASFR